MTKRRNNLTAYVFNATLFLTDEAVPLYEGLSYLAQDPPQSVIEDHVRCGQYPADVFFISHLDESFRDDTIEFLAKRLGEHRGSIDKRLIMNGVKQKPHDFIQNFVPRKLKERGYAVHTYFDYKIDEYAIQPRIAGAVNMFMDTTLKNLTPQGN